MDLEFHQIDLRYEALRQRDPHREEVLALSMATIGQQNPVVVVPAASLFILVDGFKRVRALKQLRHDTVRAITWDLAEREALLLGRLMRSATRESPLEQAWLLDELKTRFRMTLEELGCRFNRTPSWISRRLALVRELPEPVHEAVRKGHLSPHAAMKVLVPLSRTKRSDCLPFLQALLQAKCSTRQAEALYAGWARGGAEVRGRILADPVLFLRALAAAKAPDLAGQAGLALLFEDLGEIGRRARRAAGRIQEGVLDGLLPREVQELQQALHQVQSNWQALLALARKEADCA